MSESIRIKQFDTALPLPQYKTPGAAAFDLSARLQVTIEPGEHGKVPLNVAIHLPEGHWAMLSARSSLHKKGLAPINGVGIMDNDYSGNDDEYLAVLFNFSKQAVTIEPGERIMQAVVLPYNQFPIQAVTSLTNESRGGLGTTGAK